MKYFLNQVDRLNADLLSQQARRDKCVQELRARHTEELNAVKEKYEDDVSRLQGRMDQLQDGAVKVSECV